MEYLSVDFQSLGATVDRENKVLRGYVMAMEGDFSDGRGAFDRNGLKGIAEMVNRSGKGLKSRWGHPPIFGDALGSFLGRSRSARMDTTLNREGKRVAAVRGDLHLDESSFDTPKGNLGDYLLRLAESDPDALSSSLVILPRVEERRGQSSLWFPEALRASDIVEEGAAVAGLLNNADALYGKVAELFNRAFGDDARVDLESFVADYVRQRYGDEARPETPQLDSRRLRLDKMSVALRELASK